MESTWEYDNKKGSSGILIKNMKNTKECKSSYVAECFQCNICSARFQVVVTPRVREEVRKHYNCNKLSGAELEDQGEEGTALTHWEKRLFEVRKLNYRNHLYFRIMFYYCVYVYLHFFLGCENDYRQKYSVDIIKTIFRPLKESYLIWQ